MICKNCNTVNEEDASVCANCGASFEEKQPVCEPQSADVNARSTEDPIKSCGITRSVFAAILAVLNFNIFGLIFAVISLKNYDRYHCALSVGEPDRCNEYAKKTAKFAKLSLAFSIALLIIRPIFLISFLLVGASTTGFLDASATLAILPLI